MIGGGYLIDILVFGGERWFVYVLFLVFCIMALMKKWLNPLWVVLLMLLSVGLTIFVKLPSWLLCGRVVRFLFFFLLGGLYKQYYDLLYPFMIKYRWVFYTIFIICNVVFVRELVPIHFLMKFILPVIGCSVFFILSDQLVTWQKKKGDNFIFKYLRYAGKYSLQFYLLSFAFPIIRYAIITVLKITNPYMIVFLIMILQLIAITIIIELTKRIKFLKIPLGY